MYVRIQDAHDDRAALRARLASAEREARTLCARIVTAQQEAMYARDAWGFSMDRIGALQHQRHESDDRLTRKTVRTRRSTTNQIPNNEGEVNQTALDQLVTQCVAGALAAMESNRSSTQEETNRTSTTTHTFFRVSKVEDGDRVKYVACTMLDGALTWWNSYVSSVGIDAANATPWSKFKQMLIKKYCPRSEVHKMEAELWNLKEPRPGNQNQGSQNGGNDGQGNQDGNKARGNSNVGVDNAND
ncbi:putative reverse transcriptase domain-containing protein [Tanacetum coccineum]